MTEQIHQINVSFVPLEDRLLLRMTAGKSGFLMEYRVWLTRRFVRLLWTILDQMIEQERQKSPLSTRENRRSLQRFQEELALMEADFSTPLREEAVTLPFGEEPILAFQVQSGYSRDGQQVLFLNDKGMRGINITMNQQLIHSVRKLVGDAIHVAQWDLKITADEAVMGTDDVPRTIN